MHPKVLFMYGILNRKILDQLVISTAEVKEAMGEHGVEQLSQVKLAMLEVDGNISIISGDSNTLQQTHHKRRKIHKTLGSTQ